MANQTDELLARELGKVGSLAGKMSGVTGAEQGGSLAARLTARYLPTEQCRQQLARHETRPPFSSCMFISHIARPHRQRRRERHLEFPKISAVIGSGFLKMNPAVVHVEVVGVDDHGCTLQITGAAKEGLIRQRTAEKAVARVVEFLKTMV